MSLSGTTCILKFKSDPSTRGLGSCAGEQELKRVASGAEEGSLRHTDCDKKGQDEGTTSRHCLPLSGQCFNVYGVLYYTFPKLRNIAVTIFEFI